MRAAAATSPNPSPCVCSAPALDTALIRLAIRAIALRTLPLLCTGGCKGCRVFPEGSEDDLSQSRRVAYPRPSNAAAAVHRLWSDFELHLGICAGLAMSGLTINLLLSIPSDGCSVVMTCGNRCLHLLQPSTSHGSTQRRKADGVRIRASCKEKRPLGFISMSSLHEAGVRYDKLTVTVAVDEGT